VFFSHAFEYSALMGSRSIPRWLRGVGIAVATVLVLHLGDALLHLGSVVRGVWMSGVSLSGQNREEAENVLRELEARLRDAPLRVSVGGDVHEVKPAELGFSLDVKASVDAALAAGRRNPFSDFGFWLARFFTPLRIPAVVAIDEERARRFVDGWEKQAGGPRPFGGGVKIVGDALAADPPRPGQIVDRTRALALLKAALADPSRSSVSLPVTDAEPFVVEGEVERALARANELTRRELVLTSPSDAVALRLGPAELRRAVRSEPPTPQNPKIELSLDPTSIDASLVEVRKALEAPPESARFFIDARDRVSVVPGRSGTLIAPERVARALMDAAAHPDKTAPLPIERGAEPDLTTAEAEALKIQGLVSQHTTHHVCCQARVDNIHRAADILDATIVESGGIASLNAMLGPRTAKNGFKEAPTIEEGEMVDSLGGGVSQFATTFFNALFLGGYQIEERTPHTYWFSRYPMGRDATLSWPKPDVIFVNDTGSGLLIRALYTDTSITVKIYGDNGGRKVRYRVSPQQDMVKPTIEYIPDPERPPDDEKVKEAGQIGWTVFVTRDIEFANGQKRQDRRKVVYKPRVRRVFVHPCKIPEGEPGHTGDKCPEPEDAGTDAE
jgi:vancomycin resistance protein YoaR